MVSAFISGYRMPAHVPEHRNPLDNLPAARGLSCQSFNTNPKHAHCLSGLGEKIKKYTETCSSSTFVKQWKRQGQGRTIIEVDVRHDDTFWEGIGIHRKVVVLCGYLHLSRCDIANGVVAPVVPEQQLEGFASECLT
jgi:hypothetical protein